MTQEPCGKAPGTCRLLSDYSWERSIPRSLPSAVPTCPSYGPSKTREEAPLGRVKSTALLTVLLGERSLYSQRISAFTEVTEPTLGTLESKDQQQKPLRNFREDKSRFHCPPHVLELAPSKREFSLTIV